MNEASWDGSTDEAIDSTINESHGTAKYATGGSTLPDTTASGKLNRCGEFTGSNNIGYQYVDCGDKNVLNLTSAFSFEVWINPSESQEVGSGDAHTYNHGVASKADDPDSSTQWSWQLRYGSSDSNRLGFQFNDSGGSTKWVTAKQDLTTGTWYHVVGTYDGTNIKFYLDSVEKDSDTLGGITSYPDTELLIANEGWANCFLGKIDNVRIYDRALTKDEVNALYSNGNGTEDLGGCYSTTTSTSSSTSSSISSSSSSSSSSSVSVSSSSSSSISVSSSSSSISTSSISSSISSSSSSSSISISSSSSSLTSSSSSSLSSSISTSSTIAPDGTCWGEESPTDGEIAISWTKWSDGSGGSITVSGDSDWGKAEFEPSEIGHSSVHDTGTTDSKVISVATNVYGSGSGTSTIYIRGQDTEFSQDDASPSWEEYTDATTKSWQWIQVKVVGTS